MTVHQWLTDRKLAEAVGSPGILAELLVGFATHLNVGSYIRIVKDKSLLRCLQTACTTIVQDIADAARRGQLRARPRRVAKSSRSPTWA